MRNRTFLFAVCCALFVGAICGSAQASLIVNGSFENANTTYTQSPYDTLKPFNSKTFSGTRCDNLADGLTDWMRLVQNHKASKSGQSKDNNNAYLDYRALEGWTVYGQVDWKSGDADGAGRGYWRAEDGDLSLDLNGEAGGGVAQTLTTTVGHEYTVSFWMSGNPFGGGTKAKDGIRTMEVAVGNGTVKKMSFTADKTTFTGTSVVYKPYSFATNDPNGDGNTSDALADYKTGHPITNMDWKFVDFNFTATSTTTTLLFQSLMAKGSAGVVLDNVSVIDDTTAPTPEPATLALLAAGATLLIRRRARGVNRPV
jgi:hypothetical protein